MYKLPAKETTHKILKDIPYVIDNWLTQEEIDFLVNMIEENKNRDLTSLSPDSPLLQYAAVSTEQQSRIFVPFIMPRFLAEKCHKIAKEFYPEPLEINHFHYIEYDPKYGQGKYNPNLNPHFDFDNNILTIDYQLDNDIEWELNVEGEKHLAKTNQVLVFSAINQIHWRPKRVFKEGETCKVITINMTTLDDYMFNNGVNPLDWNMYPEVREAQLEEFNNREDMRKFADMYEEGL